MEEQYEANSEKILNLLKQGDEYTYELIFRRYYASLCSFATRFVNQPEVAEEIVQNIFLNLWEHRTTINIDRSLKSYLFRTVYNRCNNHLAHLKVKNNYLRFAETQNRENQFSASQTSNNFRDTELDEIIKTEIEALPESCKKIFKMSRFEGLKYKEIATYLNISQKTVETQISRALAKLREELKEYRIS